MPRKSAKQLLDDLLPESVKPWEVDQLRHFLFEIADRIDQLNPPNHTIYILGLDLTKAPNDKSVEYEIAEDPPSSGEYFGLSFSGEIEIPERLSVRVKRGESGAVITIENLETEKL